MSELRLQKKLAGKCETENERKILEKLASKSLNVEKSIQSAIDKAYEKAGHNAYFDGGFMAGIEYQKKQFDEKVFSKKLPHEDGWYWARRYGRIESPVFFHRGRGAGDRSKFSYFGEYNTQESNSKSFFSEWEIGKFLST